MKLSHVKVPHSFEKQIVVGRHMKNGVKEFCSKRLKNNQRCSFTKNDFRFLRLVVEVSSEIYPNFRELNPITL